MKLNEMPKEEKPRERLLRGGPGQLSNTEILAILIGTGTRTRSAVDLAGELLGMHEEGVRHLADCSPEELREIRGMGDAKICTVLAAVELGRRIAASPSLKYGKVRDSDDIARRYMERMRYHREEHFLCICLDTRGSIIEEHEVSIGDISGTAAGPREVFMHAIRRNAGCVIFLHNHPSEDPSPSEEDRAVTRRLSEAGRLLGIPVLDHLVIGDGTYVSMKTAGMI